MSSRVFTCGADYGNTMAFLKTLFTHEFMSSIQGKPIFDM